MTSAGPGGPNRLASRREVEAWRDRAFRRLPARRVRGEASALRFVEEVGLCFTLSDFGLPVASLYVAVCGRRHPRRPRHTHLDPEIGLTWNLKDALPARRQVYYGKLVRGKPTLVSLGLFPAFCALIRGGKGSGDYLLDYRQGRMSRPAASILESLLEAGPRLTPELRRAVGLVGPAHTATFDRAMAELQRGLWVVKVEEVYEPDFAYRWDLLDHWLPDSLEAGRGLSKPAAARRILQAYLAGAGAAPARFLASLFGLGLAEVSGALAGLEADGLVATGRPIRGLPGEQVVWTGGRRGK